jgi:hypothetical protein
MMRSSLCLWLLSQVWSGHAFVITQPPDFQIPTPTITGRGIKAVVPTTAGEIGVNPVLSDLGDAETYIGQIFWYRHPVYKHRRHDHTGMRRKTTLNLSVY